MRWWLFRSGFLNWPTPPPREPHLVLNTPNGIKFLDAIVFIVGDKNITSSVDRHTHGEIKLAVTRSRGNPI